jgi:plasmid stabilization system protein ParE
VATWWRANRPRTPDLFEEELEEAVMNLATQPDLGRPYETVRGTEVRRLLLPKTEQHVYYGVDDATETVIVYTVWGARRGRRPKF